MLAKNTKKQSGFTLLELLIIIAIIGILSTVAVVNLRSSKDKALDAQVFGTLAQLRSAVVACMYEDQPLRCGANGLTACAGNGAPAPTPGQSICFGTETVWLPLTDRPDMRWYKARSSPATGSFCFEMEQDPYLYSVPLYFTCTEEGCEKRFSTLCSNDCELSGEGCINDSECCGAMTCIANICGHDPDVLIGVMN